ncbi:MAG: VWA domain-containing protein [Gammaproteobacteria bacterium]|nr:VWA domain-containing protein [Gammaproteobacteria bacterium]
MKALKFIALSLTLLAVSIVGGCDKASTVAPTRGVYMLIDTSGTYTNELEKAQTIINFVLAKLNPGDSFAVASINTGSFTEKDIVAKITFDDRPSMANAQKRQFRDKIDRFVKNVHPSAYTDVTGGLLQAIEFLNEKNPGHKTILIFSDLKEELKKGYVRDIPLQLNGFDVVALNVTKLHSDNVDPREYLDRLEKWRKRVESGGGTWRVINDLERLDNILGPS